MMRRSQPVADLSILPPPTGAPVTPKPQVTGEQIKEAHEQLDAALSGYEDRERVARKALIASEREHDAAIMRARKALEAAKTPERIASIGVVRRVILTATTIQTPKGTYPLTSDVQARAEQHGNKQVVQGWVFKSDNDRREVYLHLEGPDWADVVPFAMKHSVSTPRELHDFAAKVLTAARNADAARAELARRTDAATRALTDVLADRSAIEERLDDFVSSVAATNDLEPALARLQGLLVDADTKDRKVRKASDALARTRRRLEQYRADSERASAGLATAGTAAANEVRQLREHGDPSLAAATVDETRTEQVAAVQSSREEPDVFEQIRKLGELRDAGFVTAEEFEAKKTELLSRL
jgi:hypothetical protein